MTAVGPRARLWIASAAVASGLVCLAVALLPVLERRVAPELGWARLAFRPACHQIPERCLDLGDGPLPVCARCFGLYVGGWLGLTAAAVAGRKVRPRLAWIVVAALPSALDFVLGFTPLPTLGDWPRFAVAIPPALLTGLLLANAVADLGSRRIA